MDLNAITLGGLINSALYFAAVFVAAIVEGNWLASRLVIAAIGVTFLAYMLQIARGADDKIAGGVGLASILLGVAAGVPLLFG